ncbi:CaiB/BaiF CoA transferase family protein [Rhodoligotrophos defluvii]|uniref:CaiB/BaiF CoA transferase family protein n=1 Tax=Rhodoligotrophos defluvii TaxID=2561934 RepID=UPI0010C9765B|nr:CaiB/BaiF CoA-transferase family protein [Rhodoligotrophos defluvii]
MRALLDGIRVVSLAEQYPGPYATLLLGDLGADVIQVERPGGGDPARQFPEFFAAINRGKRSVCLDLKTETGKQALRDLITTADVLLEGFRPGTMQRLGFGPDEVAKINPRTVYISISGFGQTGPYRERPAHDLSYQAISGFMFRDARAGRTSAGGEIAIGDLSSGMFAALAALAGIVSRSSTGKGTYIDVSMTDGLVSWMSVFLAPVLNGAQAEEIGEEPAYGTFTCADGKLISLSIAHEDWFWQPFCRLVGLDHAVGYKRPQRVAERVELARAIAERLATRPREEWAAAFDRAGIAWSPVHDLDEVVRDPHFIERGMFATVVEDDGSRRRYVAQPLTVNAHHPGPARGVPALGAHTSEVLDSLAQHKPISARS